MTHQLGRSFTKRDLSEESIDFDDISYQIDINPNKYTMNKGQTLTLTDRINTNVDLRAGTVKIKDESGDDVTSTSGIQISYNDDTRMLVLNNIPDATKFTLEYIVRVRSLTRTGTETETFDNSATLIGGGSHTSKVSVKHFVEHRSATMTGDIALVKIDENDLTKTLPGAEFELYRCDVDDNGKITNVTKIGDKYRLFSTKLLMDVDNATSQIK